MQGLFIHVSDGNYPVASTLIFTNQVRVNNLSPVFHKDAYAETRPLLRLSTRLTVEGSRPDPAVVYFDPDATIHFEKESDALKLMNTDVLVPSLYIKSPDGRNLSISGIPEPTDSVTEIPLGLKVKKGGPVLFTARDIENMPFGLYWYLRDKKTGACQNLVLHPDYKVHLDEGDYEDRFYLVFSRYDLRYQPGPDEPFHIFSSRNRLFIYSDQMSGETINILIHNMLGQQILRRQFTGNGYQEIDMNVSPGIYIVSLYSSKEVYSKKVYLNNQW